MNAVGAPAPALSAGRWNISGIVQGVGFRPFVYRLAREYGLNGWVRNCVGRVEVFAVGDAAQLDAFAHDLIARAPAIARPRIDSFELLDDHCTDERFSILDSDASAPADIHLPVDYFVCDECRAELDDPADRRFRYPFINCTQCGPRYTLIRSLPYDRPNTSMAAFPLCEACRSEYLDPSHRRFHAEPIACPDCGPHLQYRDCTVAIDETDAALSAAEEALRQGLIIAVKGVGGYHLVCDAGNAEAIERLRQRKPRPHKPLAVMYSDHDGLAALRQAVNLDALEQQFLCSPARPIVLLRKRSGAALADNIAPGLDELGVMLPYSPLHHLLLSAFGRPLVVTSANPSGEPVLTQAHEVSSTLGHVAEAFLHHDRPIVRPADDPVYRRIAGVPRPLRFGRGVAPLEMTLASRLDRPVLAVGGHMKNTVCLAWQQRAVVSPHIGDMDAVRSLQVFEQVVADLQALYGVRAELIVCDRHPGYATTRWAQRQGLPVVQVQHHAAHASALLGEHEVADGAERLVFTWDGVGLGDDGTLWGGEALLGQPGQWKRVASMRPFRTPGAVRAGREPWRSGAVLAWEIGDEQAAARILEQAGLTRTSAVFRRAWEQSLNAPESSAVGRLFDAAAALTGCCVEASFEGQGPMLLEACASGTAPALPLPLQPDAQAVLRTDWRPLMQAMACTTSSVAERAALFHTSLAAALVQQALAVRAEHRFDEVGLCGGVFQNRRLTENCVAGLRNAGFRVLLGEQLPVNDAGISFGQVVEYAQTQAVEAGGL
ncbi:MAG: carbamoyltransferase HypF [Thiogranum sp.]|nr:carbamoyltransferase HypF [Thiogranum sp.]